MTKTVFRTKNYNPTNNINNLFRYFCKLEKGLKSIFVLYLFQNRAKLNKHLILQIVKTQINVCLIFNLIVNLFVKKVTIINEKKNVLNLKIDFINNTNNTKIKITYTI